MSASGFTPSSLGSALGSAFTGSSLTLRRSAPSGHDARKADTSASEYEYEYVYEEEETPENIHLNLQLQILSELRAMNEEKRLRHEQKQRNKQIKEQVQKQLYKERNKNYFEETPTVGRVDIKEPSQQNKTQVGERRRLNLLRKYY